MARNVLRSALYVGKCVAHEVKGAAKVEVKLLKLDENLNMVRKMYFLSRRK